MLKNNFILLTCNLLLSDYSPFREISLHITMDNKITSDSFLTTPEPQARALITGIQKASELDWLINNSAAKKIFVFSFTDQVPYFLLTHPLYNKVIVPIAISYKLSHQQLYKFIQDALQPYFEFFAEGKVAISWHREIYRQHTALCKIIEEAVLNYTRLCLSTVAVRAMRGWHNMLDSCLNVRRHFHSFSILKNSLKGSSAVIVGAGPSLDKSYELIKKLQTKLLIIACDGALPSLSKAGIKPDLVVSVDGTEKVWRYFLPVKDDPELITLMVPESCWALQRYCKGNFLMAQTQKSYNGLLLDEPLKKELPLLNIGLCVGHAAFNAACFMGASMIIMLAFDLGYDSTGSFHPSDMPVPYFHIAPPSEVNIIYVNGNDGKMVKSELSMVAYLQEFERLIEQSNLPVWNMTIGGALIRGTYRPKEADIEQLLNAAKKVDLQKILEKSRKITVSSSHINSVITKASKMVSALEASVKTGSWRRHLLNNEYPFVFLSEYKKVIDGISDAENPLPIIDFNFSFEDWRKHKNNALLQDELIKKGEDVIFSLSLMGSLIEKGLQLPIVNNDKGKPIRIAAVTRRQNGFYKWEDMLASLIQNPDMVLTRFLVDAFISDFWKKLMKEPCHLVIATENELMPAGWATAGIACIEIKESVPESLKDGAVIIEQWLPGYAVLTRNEEVACKWRIILPDDISVYLWDENSFFLITKDRLRQCAHFEQIVFKIISQLTK